MTIRVLRRCRSQSHLRHAVLCIYGEDEHDSLCPKLDPKKFIVVKVKGGHHFDGNYAGLADDILNAAKPP